jgi:REP element-mobilizing transposase RayT
MARRKTVRHFHEVGHLHELTFSCYRRMPSLTNDMWRGKLARCVEAAGSEAAMELVGFVFMPEHVHLLVHPTVPSPSISRYLARIKQPFSKRIKEMLVGGHSRLLPKLFGAGAAGEEVFSLLARRPRFRPESVFSRCHLVIPGIHAQQPCQPRPLSAGGGLEMVVGQVLPQSAAARAASQLADD